MMRILFVAPRFHTNQYQVVKTLQEEKHEVHFHVASIGFTEDHSLLAPKRYKQSKLSRVLERIFGQGGVNRPNYFPNPYRYWKEFKQLKPDVAVIRDPYKYFSLLAAFCALFTKTRVVFYTQENIFRATAKKTSIKRKLTLQLFKAAWITPMQSTACQNAQAVKHLYYVPLPIPLMGEAVVKKVAEGEEIKILMVGKYHQSRKNHFLLLKAIHNLKGKYRFRVTMVGECVREQQVVKFNMLQGVVQDLGLSGIVDLKQNVPFSKMKELYLSHHFFVLPARDEQYGVSVTEALGYGLPAICSDTCGARFNIQDGENGYVVKSDSLEELTDAMEKLLSDKTRLSRMSENSLDYVHKHLSGTAYYSRFSHVLQDRFQLQPNDKMHETPSFEYQ